MSEMEAIVWGIGIIATGVTVTSVVKSISDAAAKIKSYRKEIDDDRKNDSEDR